MTRFNTETFEAYKEILCSGKRTFYADDFDLCGGTINALQRYGLIQSTGRTKDVFIPVDDELYRKVKVLEWECTILSEKPSTGATIMRAECLEDIVAAQRKFIKMFEHICEIELAMIKGRR